MVFSVSSIKVFINYTNSNRTFFQHIKPVEALFVYCSQHSNVSEDAGIESRTVGVSARVFTKFRILEISHISNVFVYFAYYSKVATISRK